ncbi:hypothetical protein B566_EDAN018646, partial [Ephemera danica]
FRSHGVSNPGVARSNVAKFQVWRIWICYSFHQQGSTVLYRSLNSTTQGFTEAPIIHNPYKNKEVPEFALFGYAVTSGRFFSRLDVLHVAGAPRADQTLVGEQTASYFGAALAACDVNGDQFEDLIVGAPFYSDVEDEG